jgi:hypothetical protein
MLIIAQFVIREVCYNGSMTKTNMFQLAINRAAKLPISVREEIGREILERIEVVTELRVELDIDIQQLDAGLGEELDVDDFLERANAQHEKE